MNISKISHCYYLLIVVIFINIIQEHECKIGRKPATTCPTLRIQNGYVRVRPNGRIAIFKCRTGFKAVGERSATCVRGQWEGTPPICVKNGCLKVYPPKNGDMVITYGGAVVKFYCNNGFSLNGSNYQFCNGLVWNGTVPTCQAETSDPERSCDFESEDLCGWSQDIRHDFDWRRLNYATPSGHVSTGPSYDHTKGAGQDGYYMYIESSSPRTVNDKARLFSPVYPAEMSQDACFILWYHMFGATTGSLNVYVKPENVDLNALTPEFSRSGDQGNQWFRKIVRFQNTSYAFQVIVEGVRGTSYVSDTAFDDVQLANGTDCQEPVTDPAKTDTSKIETGGGGEIFDDAQSCRWRCSGNTDNSNSQSEIDSVTQSETPVMMLCDCHLGCIDNKTCCPDYSSYCILAKVTSFPVAPTLGYRTIGSVHYFSLFPPPPPTRLPRPPPLPPLPPKPTVTSPALPNSTPLPLNFSTLPPVTDKTQPPSNSPHYNTSAITQMPTHSGVESPLPVSSSISIRDSQSIQPEIATTLESIGPTSKSPEIIASTPVPTEKQTLKINITFSDIAEIPRISSEIPPVQNTSNVLNITDSTIKSVVTSSPLTTSTKLSSSAENNTLKLKNITTITTSIRYVTTSTVVPIIVVTKKNPTKIVIVNEVIKSKFVTTLKTVQIKPSKFSPRPTIPTLKPTQPKKQNPFMRTTTTTTRLPPPSRLKTTENKMYNPYSKGANANDAETRYILKKELIDLPKRKSGSISQQQPQQSTQDSSWAGAPMIIGIVAGVVLIAVAVGITMFGVVWRRRRTSSQRKNLNEDSDVRFLTSDEALDFNLARPTENEELC